MITELPDITGKVLSWVKVRPVKDETGKVHMTIGGCEYYRQAVPHNLMNTTTPIVQQVSSILPIEDSELKKAKAVQFIRNDLMYLNGDPTPTSIAHQRLKDLSIPYIFDTDDHWTLYKEHGMNKGGGLHEDSQNRIDCITHADHVTVTNEFLADEVSKHNKNVSIIPNAITRKDPQWELVPKDIDVLTFGYIASRHHLPDVRLLEDSFKHLWSDSELRGKFKVYIFGWDNSKEWEYFVKVFSGNKHSSVDYGNNFVVLPGTFVQDFAYYYDKIDVALAPLKSNHFNICKSNLKQIEAGFKGKAVIGSATPNYVKDLVNANQIAIDENRAHKGFYKAMRKLILDHDLVRKMQVDNLEYSEKHFNLEAVNQKRIELYNRYLK